MVNTSVRMLIHEGESQDDIVVFPRRNLHAAPQGSSIPAGQQHPRSRRAGAVLARLDPCPARSPRGGAAAPPLPAGRSRAEPGCARTAGPWRAGTRAPSWVRAFPGPGIPRPSPEHSPCALPGPASFRHCGASAPLKSRNRSSTAIPGAVLTCNREEGLAGRVKRECRVANLFGLSCEQGQRL